MSIILCIQSIFCIPPSSLYQFFSISTIVCMLVCMYVCMYGGYSCCYLFLFYSSVCIKCMAQCMVCMYLIDAYCCDTGWMDCLDEDFSVRSHCSSTGTATAWSWCEFPEQGKEFIVVRYYNSNATTVLYCSVLNTVAAVDVIMK